MVNGDDGTRSNEEVPGHKSKDRVILGDPTWSRGGMLNKV